MQTFGKEYGKMTIRKSNSYFGFTSGYLFSRQFVVPKFKS